MKKIVFIVFLLSGQIYSQVGVGTDSPHSSTILHLESSNKGLLIPRLSKSERDNISSPPEGLLVFQTDNTVGFYFYSTSTSSWSRMSLSSEVNEYGDIKTGIQSTDHNGWLKLDGRAISTLTSSQQIKAGNLGLVGNLPDATNTQLTQNGASLGSLSGTNTKTITQNQLPNVNLTGNTELGGVNGRWNVDDTPWSGAGTSKTNITNRAGSESGLHTHAISIPLNGNVEQQEFDVRGAELSVNVFIYLGD